MSFIASFFHGVNTVLVTGLIFENIFFCREHKCLDIFTIAPPPPSQIRKMSYELYELHYLINCHLNALNIIRPCFRSLVCLLIFRYIYFIEISIQFRVTKNNEFTTSEFYTQNLVL